jgi:hypothetical protein
VKAAGKKLRGSCQRLFVFLPTGVTYLVSGVLPPRQMQLSGGHAVRFVRLKAIDLVLRPGMSEPSRIDAVLKGMALGTHHIGIQLVPFALVAVFAGMWGAAFALDIAKRPLPQEAVFHMAGFAWGGILLAICGFRKRTGREVRRRHNTS